jgi:hypothetical protein
MHLLPVVQINQLRQFLEQWISTKAYRMQQYTNTFRALSSSSTSETSHQFSTRHRDPSNPGLTTKYDLNKAVSTICANLNNCSGVKEDSGALGKARISSMEACDRGGNLCA